MEQVPKQPEQKGFAFEEADGTLQVGSARTAANTADEEFDYAFQGMNRQATTHKKEFQAKPVPAHLISIVRQQPLGSLGEQEEEDEEDEVVETASAAQAAAFAPQQQQVHSIPSQLAAIVANATASVAAGLPSHSASRLIAGTTPAVEAAAASSLSNNSMSANNSQALRQGLVYMVGSSATHLGISSSVPGSAGAFPINDELALGSSLVIETVDSKELLHAHTEELAEPAADHQVDTLSVDGSEDGGDMSPAVGTLAAHPAGATAIDQALADQENGAAASVDQTPMGALPSMAGSGVQGLTAGREIEGVQNQPRRAQMQLPTPQQATADIIPNTLLTSITSNTIPAAMNTKAATPLNPAGPTPSKALMDEKPAPASIPGVLSSGRVQSVASLTRGSNPFPAEAVMHHGGAGTGPPAMLASNPGAAGQAALKPPSVPYLSSFAAASLDPGTTMSEPAPVERMLHFMQGRGNSIAGAKDPMSSHTCSSAVMELPSMALLRAISRDVRSCDVGAGMQLECLPATDASLPSSAILASYHHHQHPGSAPAAAPGFNRPVLQALQPVMPSVITSLASVTSQDAVASSQKAQALTSYLRGSKVGVPAGDGVAVPAGVAVQEQTVTHDAQARAAAAAGAAALAQLRSSSSIRSRSGMPLSSGSTGYTTAPTSSQDHNQAGLYPSAGSSSTPTPAAKKLTLPAQQAQPGENSGKLPSRDCHDGWAPLQVLPLQPTPGQPGLVGAPADVQPRMAAPVVSTLQQPQPVTSSSTAASTALQAMQQQQQQPALGTCDAVAADSSSIEISMGEVPSMPVTPPATALPAKPMAAGPQPAVVLPGGAPASTIPGSTSAADKWEVVNMQREKELAAAAAAAAPSAAWTRAAYAKLLQRMDQELACSPDVRAAAEKQLQSKGSQGFLSKLLCMVRPPVPHALHEQKVHVLCWAATPYSDNQPLHWDLLASSYAALTGQKSAPQRHGSHWQVLGWQGSDPATDLRGCGVFGLLQLCSLCDEHPAWSSALYKLSRSEEQEFPLAIVSLNCTKFTLQAVRDGSLDASICAAGNAWRAVSDFHAGASATFYRLWTTGHKTMAQSGFVMKEVEELCRSNPSAVLRAAASQPA